MDLVQQQFSSLVSLWHNKRTLYYQALTLTIVVMSALMTWKGLIVWTNSESPIVVVLSGSMEPAFQRGDVLFLDNNMDEVEVGDVVVYKIKDRDIPIVHRVLSVYQSAPGAEQQLLTKGDNNTLDDRGLYAPGQMYLKRSDLLGRARGVVRYVGMATILMTDYPWFKYALLGLMGLFVLTSGDAA